MRAFFAILVLGIVVFSGTAYANGPWLPSNFSTLGEKIDHLYNMIFVLTAVMLILTEGALVFFILRFRQRPGRKAHYVHDHPVIEVVWSVIPALILIFLALYQWDAWADAKLRPPNSSEAVRVEIFAKQFEWRIRYAGPDDRFATADDITLTNQLYIPEGKTVLAQIRAEDVIHSFFLPLHRVKQDIVPGTTVQVWFDALKTGSFEIACAELCGLGHYRMRGQLFVQTPEEFQSWLQEKIDAKAVPADWGWDWEEGT